MTFGIVTRFSSRLETERTFAPAWAQEEPEQQRACERGRAECSLEIRSHYRRTVVLCSPERRTGASQVQDWSGRSLTKPTCPLAKRDTKNVVNLTMVPRYVRDWLTARASSIRECLSPVSPVSPSPARRIRAELACEPSESQGTDSHSRYARPRVTSKRTVWSNRDSLLICETAGLSRKRDFRRNF